MGTKEKRWKRRKEQRFLALRMANCLDFPKYPIAK